MKLKEKLNNGDAPTRPSQDTLLSDTPVRERPSEDGHEQVKVHILVNEHRVILVGARHTGLEIKQAAIRSDTPIDLDFVLSADIDRTGRRKIIGNGDVVQLEDGMRFVAVADDDDS